jgi:hypothetical protein
VADRAEHDHACAERGELEPWRQASHVGELALQRGQEYLSGPRHAARDHDELGGEDERHGDDRAAGVVQRPVDDVEGSRVARACVREDALGVGLAGGLVLLAWLGVTLAVAVAAVTVRRRDA